MIKRIQVLIFLFSGVQAFSQEPADALRYSWLQPSGTARTQAIGGAITSLGGDLTSTFYNPAGLGMYKTNEFVLTPGFSFSNNKADYLNSQAKDNNSGFHFGTTGLIFAAPGSRNGKWRNFSIGLGLNRIANFNSGAQISGTNNQSSYSEKYLEELINNGVTDPNDAAQNFPYGSSLAFNTFLIDTVQGPNGTVAGYRSLATPQTGVTQSQQITTKGGITDFAIGAAGNLMDKFYIGGSVGFSMLKYERNTTYREADATNDINNNFNYFTVDEYLNTTGLGINLKLGMIVKPVEQLRVGLAVHTPTYYNMEDNYTTKITTDLEGFAGSGTLSQSSIDFNDGRPGEFQYDLLNPWRFMGGISYVFSEVEDVTKQRGFISADVEFLNYRGSKFKATDPSNNAGSYFEGLNQTIDDLYKSAVNARIGGELKFNTIMVRGGFSYFSNPYADSDTKGSRMNVSGGLGYRDKGLFVDLTYVHSITKDNYFPYRLEQGFFAPAALKNGVGNVLLTVGFKF